MIRARVAVLTINSITPISKVRSNRNFIYPNLLDRINSFTLSTAAERTDFQTEIRNSDSSQDEFQRYPSGFYRENFPSASQLNQSEAYRGGPSEYQQNRNPNGFYREDDRELQRNSNELNCWKDFRQSPNRSYSEPRQVLQKPSGFQLDSNSELQRSQNGFSKQRNGEFQQNPNGHFGVSSGQFGQSRNGNYGDRVGGFQQNQDGFQRGMSNVNYQSVNNVQSEREVIRPHPNGHFSSGQFGQSPNGNYGGNVGGFQQNQDGFQRGTSNANYHSENNVQSEREVIQQNPNGHFSSGQFGQSPNGNYEGSVGGFQQNQDGFQRGMNNVNYQSVNNVQSVREIIQQHPNGHFSRGQFGQSPNGNYEGRVGAFQQNQDGFQRGTSNVNYQSVNNVQSEREVIQQNPNGHFSSGQFGQSPNGNYEGSVGGFQQNQDGFQRGTSNANYHSVNNVQSVREVIQQNPNGHFSGRQLGQSPNGNFGGTVGGLLQNQDGLWRGTSNANYQSVNNVQSKGEVIQTAETNHYMGTVDELDSFCKEGKVKEAVMVLSSLEEQGIDVDLPRYLQLMKVCGEVVATQEAKAIHNHLMRSKQNVAVTVQNKILEMYLRCGSITDAYELFEKMPTRNLSSWDTMIVGLTNNGLGEDAIDLFTQFKEAGLKPDGQMFFGIFSACAALCDIDEGLMHFESMSKVYGIAPSMDHYVGVVKMLGTTGYLDEAVEFIEKMPFEPNVDIWETLMNLCRIHGNLELGDHCAELVNHLDSSHLTDQSKLGLLPVQDSDLAKQKDKKQLSFTNLTNHTSKINEFKAGDTSQPESRMIYALLRGMREQIREAGYIPETRFCLHDVDQEDKEDALLAHSEKLAVTQGLISTAPRMQLRIIKNLRACGDCHNALKLISKLVGRDLIIRDSKRFHHFKDGVCSCGDYW